MKTSCLTALLGLAVVLSPLAAGCGSSTTTNTSSSGGAAAAAPKPAAAASAAPSASASASADAKGGYTENDFVESDRNRNPFRYFPIVQTAAKLKDEIHDVEMPTYGIDDVRLVAIVLGGDQPRAMFVDPTTRGTVVYKGTFLCRPDVVRVPGSTNLEYAIHWRVDRIRENEVVLIREDPAQPQIPAATRVVPLHPET
jgi:type IV pilus assembly protein PilP